MNKRTKALASWVLALTFLSLIFTGFALMYHVELFGLRGYPLKVVHINLAILCMVAGIGHLCFNFDTLCKYVWIRKRGPNMIGTFLAALVITTAVISFSAMTPNRCDTHGPRHQAGAGHRYSQSDGQGRGAGQGYGREERRCEKGEYDQGVGQGRGQGGQGRGMGPGRGRGLGYGRGEGRGQER